MADNISVLDAVSATQTVAGDSIGGVIFQRVKLTQGADGTNDGDVSSAQPLPVTATPITYVGQTTTRPADTTAYSYGDLVGTSTTAGSVVAKQVQATRVADAPASALAANLKISGTVVTNAIFRIHLYNVLPTFSNGDNGAWLTPNAGYLGSFDVTVDKVFSDGAIGKGYPTTGTTLNYAPVTGQNYLYYVIEARAAFTPTSAEVFTVSLEVQ